MESVVRKYVNVEDHYYPLLTGDIIWSYFQDKFTYTHYLIFTGDNGSGKNYIMHAKKINPELSEEAMSILGRCYADLAYDNKVSPRKLETLHNLARARAKLKLKDVVDVEDAKETVITLTRS